MKSKSKHNLSAPVEGSTDVHTSLRSNLHYRLTTEEWLTVSKDLRLAELRVLFYLRTLDPFGDRKLNLKVIDIAEATGLQKGTVSKALQVLLCKEFIDLEMIAIQVSVKKFPVGNQVSCEKHRSTVGNLDASQETSTHHRKPDCTVGNFQEPETIQEKDSRSPHTIHTDQTNQTLSVEPDFERETLEVDEKELLQFTIGKVKQSSEINRPRAYAKKCLRDDRDFWIDEFVKWQELQVKIDLPPPPPSTDFAVESIEQKRKRLLKLWDSVPCRPGIRQAIETYPDLRLGVIDGELKEVEG